MPRVIPERINRLEELMRQIAVIDKKLPKGSLLRELKKTISETKKKGINTKKLEATVIIYEAPHRLIKALRSIKDVFGNIELVLMRELTKIHEERVDEIIPG